METTNDFNHFDVVSDDWGHRFKNAYAGNNLNQPDSACYRAIMREWKILQQSLPESIYVRVYEHRIDLMRAMIVGAAGTPYHDGLFFIDIAFPSDYPNKPPKIDFGVYPTCFMYSNNVNPNVYSDGKVCLSLLNTWYGTKTEMWDPSRSTMLQVLVSIQGLVLNENPFFNHPGSVFLSRFLDLENRSRAYNESVFLRTMFNSLGQVTQPPPRNFEAYMRAHFRERGSSILKACIEYANGRVRIGYYNYHLHPSSQVGYCSSRLRSSSSSSVHVSRKFKKLMVTFYPKFFRSFRNYGVSLEGLSEHLELAENEECENTWWEIFKKIVEKIKQTFAWKKYHRD